MKLILQKFVKLKVNGNAWIEKALRYEWTNHLEKNLDLSEENPDAFCMWEYFKSSMKDASKLCIPNKKISNRSKPFWFPELTHASKELRNLRRKLRYNSNYRNLTKLNEAKVSFKTLLSEKASNWMNEYLLNLGHKRGKGFWMSYKKLFNENKPNVG